MSSTVRGIILNSLIIVLATALAYAQQPVALERMKAVAAAYFESHRTGDPEQVRAFEAEHRAASALERRSIDERIKRWEAMFAQTGAVTPGDIVRSTDSTIVYVGRVEKLDMWVECAFKFEAEPPHKLFEVMIRPTSSPDQNAASVGEWDTVSDLLVQMASQSGVPAIAAAVIVGDEIVDAAAVGVRALGGADSVTIDDYWHIGSVTKSVTATMIGRLVEMGVLRWDVTLVDALPNIDMRPEYAGVTLEDLLHHRGGIQPYTLLGAEDEVRLSKLEGNPTEIRAGFAAEVLQREPANPRGTFDYSNAGYVLAALIAERATGQTWQELVQHHVFDAMGLAHAVFGWPANPGRPEQPRGHFLDNGELRTQGLEEYPLGEYLAPAGDVSMSIVDLARYARMHLSGLRGEDGAVTAATTKWLHAAPPAADSDTRYAGGWVITDAGGMGEAHWHNGSAGTFYAQVVVYPERNRAVVVAMNVGVQRGQALAERIIELINARSE